MKMVTVGLGVAVVVLAVLLHRAHAAAGPVAVGSGEVRPDARGAKDLAAKQIVLGSKAVAEAAKAGQLGPLKAENRQVEKHLRKG